MDAYKYTFTVFTPTYNRQHSLNRVYDSLCRQTYCNFEWLIVDDGSNDDTESLVNSWKKESTFPIRYYYQKNSGKHVALNKGVTLAHGELFLNFDSDDSCDDNALERFKYHWDQIPTEKKHLFSAVTTLCKDEQGQIVGKEFPQDILDSNSLEIEYKYKQEGDKWGFHRTDVLKKFPFPEVEGCKFIPEGIVWTKIATQYQTRFVNEALYTYHQDDSSGSDQLTHSNSFNEAYSHELWHRNTLNDHMNWFMYDPKKFFKVAVHYARFSFHAGTSIIQQVRGLNNYPAKILYTLSLLPAWFVYIIDKMKK